MHDIIFFITVQCAEHAYEHTRTAKAWSSYCYNFTLL